MNDFQAALLIWLGWVVVFALVYFLFYKNILNI